MKGAHVNWSEIKVDGITGIDRVVAEFTLWAHEKLPFPNFKVKITESTGVRGFHGSPNVAVRNPQTGHPEWIGGRGASVEEALEDAVKWFFHEIDQQLGGRELRKEDFEWSDPTEF